MQAGSGTTLGPGPRAISISEAMADWHAMICGEPDEPVKDRSICRFLDARISPEVDSGTLDLITFDDDFILLNMRGHFHENLNYKIVGEG